MRWRDALVCEKGTTPHARYLMKNQKLPDGHVVSASFCLDLSVEEYIGSNPVPLKQSLFACDLDEAPEYNIRGGL